MKRFLQRIRLVIARIAVVVLPHGVLERYRRRRALRKYLKALAYEIYDRQIRLEIDDLDGRIAARRDGFYDRLVKDVLERTELILQELDRRIEGLTARHGNELRSLRADVEALRSEVRTLRSSDGVVALTSAPNGGQQAPNGDAAPLEALPSLDR